MKLDNKELFDLLSRKGILYLYHANTVTTSKTFIEQNGLLSRGAVELKNLRQTVQSTDSKDKVFDVWNDIFLDTADLHIYFSRQNYYGPVLFKISTQFLNDTDEHIWITKDNPKYWNSDMTIKDKYFENVEELESNWEKYETQRKMITIKNASNPMLFDYLEEVIVDNPRVKYSGIIFHEQTVKSLKQSLLLNPVIKDKFKTRECRNCFCKSNYLYQVNVNDLKRLFL